MEAELSVPHYDIEERIYSSIMYASRHADDVYLQTYDTRLPLVCDIADGNFKTFFSRLLAERKRFWYPPYTQMVRIMVEKKTDAQVTKLAGQIYAKLFAHASDTHRLSYDEERIERYGQLRRQEILLRSDDVMVLLDVVATDIIKNSGVWVEWK